MLEGSHRLVNRHIATTGTWRPAEVRAALAAAYPWLGEVWRGRRRPGDEAVLDGVRTTVRELTGGPATPSSCTREPCTPPLRTPDGAPG